MSRKNPNDLVTTRVPREVMLKAMELAEGDMSRVKIARDGQSVTVVNRSEDKRSAWTVW